MDRRTAMHWQLRFSGPLVRLESQPISSRRPCHRVRLHVLWLVSAEHHCGGWGVVQVECVAAAGAAGVGSGLELWCAVGAVLGWHHRAGVKSFLTAEYLCAVAYIILFSSVFVIAVSLLDLVRVGKMEIVATHRRVMKGMLIKAGWVEHFIEAEHACSI